MLSKNIVKYYCTSTHHACYLIYHLCDFIKMVVDLPNFAHYEKTRCKNCNNENVPYLMNTKRNPQINIRQVLMMYQLI